MSGELARANVLELAIARAKGGVLPMQALLWTLSAAELVVVNRAEQPQSLEPLVVEREGSSFLAAFTRAENAEEALRGGGTVILMQGRDILERLPEAAGIALNPGSSLGFELPAAGASAFRAELALPAV